MWQLASSLWLGCYQMKAVVLKVREHNAPSESQDLHSRTKRSQRTQRIRQSSNMQHDCSVVDRKYFILWMEGLVTAESCFSCTIVTVSHYCLRAWPRASISARKKSPRTGRDFEQAHWFMGDGKRRRRRTETQGDYKQHKGFKCWIFFYY